MRPFPLSFSSFFPLALLGATGVARADGPPATATAPHPHTYAVVIGSNAGGAGQAPLHFAEDDAKRVAEVLRELGHYAAEDVDVLLHPDAAAVVSAIDELGAKVRANAARGEQSEVVFYYSGHARASAVTPGGEEIPLTTLRERLSALPATLTIVVLDACQSGAFARVKGAEPAADFTYNSVSRLTQKGLAVMASSTSQELSQESDELKASYFTHHFVTALRGAGDADGDGRVSLDEAYRYAYRRTLASTARTQVGEQHVTLETDLEGQGDVPVTYPSEARAQLELPGALDARVLVQHRASGAVVAEVQKVAGPPLRLAFVAGAYDAVVGRPGGIVQCRFSLVDDQVTPLDTTGCTPVRVDKTSAKGEGEREPFERERDRWALEGAAGFIWAQTGGYTQTLQNFGYQRQTGLVDLPAARFTLGASRIFVPHIAGVLQLSTLASDSYQRSIEGSTDTASLSAYGGGLYVRAFTDVRGPWFGVYAQVGGGVGVGVLNYATQQTGVPPSSSETYVGYMLGGAAGMTARFQRVPVTLFAQAGYDVAPVIHNLIGDTLDSGGPSFVIGFRIRLGDDR
jgi:hypothetical protein